MQAYDIYMKIKRPQQTQARDRLASSEVKGALELPVAHLRFLNAPLPPCLHLPVLLKTLGGVAGHLSLSLTKNAQVCGLPTGLASGLPGSRQVDLCKQQVMNSKRQNIQDT